MIVAHLGSEPLKKSTAPTASGTTAAIIRTSILKCFFIISRIIS